MSRSIDKIPLWKRSAAVLAALGAAAAGGGLAGCASPEHAPASVSASATPGEKTPEATASPDTQPKVVDIEHASTEDLKNLTQEQIFPLPEQFKPDALVSDRGKISETFTISAEEGDTPEKFIAAHYTRVNAFLGLGSDQDTIKRGYDGDDAAAFADKEEDFLAGWQAMSGLGSKARPTPAVHKNFKTAFYANMWTGMAPLYGPVPPSDTVTAIAEFPLLDTLEVTQDSDGSWSGTIQERDIFKVNQSAVDAVVSNTPFTSVDTITTRKFEGCKVDLDTNTVTCKAIS